MKHISANLELIRQEMEFALRRGGRPLDAGALIAVSKTWPAEYIMEAYRVGQRDFGENKVQELLEKAPKLPQDIRWHMIGHLQTNKVRALLPHVYCIHSVDSLRLARRIQEEAAKAGLRPRILLEVNMAGELSKYGLRPEEAEDVAKECGRMGNLALEGLMTVAPLVEDGEQNRPVFAALKQLSVDIHGKNIDNVKMGHLSMGMSGDFSAALEEGATWIRVGSAIFGHREYF